MNDSIARAREWISAARRIAVLTGAGISAESGIPTFRGPGGLWRNYRPEDLATPEAFARDPKLVREWYQWRRGIVRRAQPNAAHRAIAGLERRTPEFLLITQNVDDLHERAGSKHIAKLHGAILMDRCAACGAEGPARDEDHCPCGGWLRPGVVWFGESLPGPAWDLAERFTAASELLLVAGTSAAVYPAASLIPLGRQSGAKVIEVNLEETPASRAADLILRGPAAELLPQIL